MSYDHIMTTGPMHPRDMYNQGIISWEEFQRAMQGRKEVRQKKYMEYGLIAGGLVITGWIGYKLWKSL